MSGRVPKPPHEPAWVTNLRKQGVDFTPEQLAAALKLPDPDQLPWTDFAVDPMVQQIAAAIGIAMAPMCPMQFARTYLRTERGEVLDYEHRPYLWSIMLDEAPEQCVVACAQSGKTVQYLAKAFHYCVFPKNRASRTVIYTFPTKDDVQQFASARAKTMIGAVPLMAAQMGDVDNTEVKQFKNLSTMYFRGTWTDRGAISVPADMLVHDELDRSKPDTLTVYEDRTGNSDDPHRWLFSTPTVPSYGISAVWKHSCQREWHWYCPACGMEQCFAPMDKSFKWQEHLDFDRRCFQCAKCGAPIGADTIAAGRWVEYQPGARVSGYHITSILRPNLSPGRLVDAFQRTEFPHLFTQGQIGLPEVAADSELTEDMIVFGDWPNASAITEHETVAGLDQGKHLDLMVGDGKGKILAIHRYNTWAEIHAAMNLFRIALLVVDMYPETRPAQDLVAAFPGRVMLADYSLLKPPTDVWFEREAHEARLRLNRTNAMDVSTVYLVNSALNGDKFPALPADLKRTLLDHLCAPKRTTEMDSNNQPKGVWIETGPDHFRHAHVYYRTACAFRGAVPGMPAFWAGTVQKQEVQAQHQGKADAKPEPVIIRQVDPNTIGPAGVPGTGAGRDVYSVYPALKKR